MPKNRQNKLRKSNPALLHGRYGKGPSIVVQAEEDGICSAMNLETLETYQLDGMASEIFQKLEPGVTAEELVVRMSRLQKVPIDELTPVVEQFIKFLVAKKLVIAVGAPESGTYI